MKIIILFLTLFSFTSCVEFYYAVPQPKGVKKLDAFPEELLGNYIYDVLKNNKDTLIISSNSICVIYRYKHAVSQRMTDSFNNLKIVGDLIYDSDYDSSAGFKYQITNDSIVYCICERKVINLCDTVILKKYKSKYFLSILNSDNNYYSAGMIEKEKCGSYKVYNLTTFSYSNVPKNDSAFIKPDKDDPPVFTKEEIISTYSGITHCTYLTKVKSNISDTSNLAPIDEDEINYLVNPSKRKLMKVIRTMKKKEMLVPWITLEKLK